MGVYAGFYGPHTARSCRLRSVFLCALLAYVIVMRGWTPHCTFLKKNLHDSQVNAVSFAILQPLPGSFPTVFAMCVTTVSLLPVRRSVLCSTLLSCGASYTDETSRCLSDRLRERVLNVKNGCNTSELSSPIKACLGCSHCWSGMQGLHSCKDDMSQVPLEAVPLSPLLAGLASP